MPDLQWYPRNLNLIKNVEDNVVSATQVFISVNFSLVPFKQEMRKSLLTETRNKKSLN